jgi:hypothetical protein
MSKAKATQPVVDLSPLLGEANRKAIAEAARSNPTAVIIQSTPLLAEVAAARLAELLVPALQARLMDVRVLAPESTTWTVDEVSRYIVAPAMLTPTVRNIIVILDADRMSTGCAEHLLKVIEEPSAPTTFCLCVTDSSLLLPTIRGRVSTTLDIHVSARDLATWLDDSGLPAELSAQAAAHLGDQAALLASLSASPELAQDLVNLAATWPSHAKPATTALAGASLITKVIAASTSPLEGQNLPSNPTLLRRRQRRLAAAILDSWGHLLATEVTTTTHIAPEQVSRWADQRTALDDAGIILERHGPVDVALALGAAT